MFGQKALRRFVGDSSAFVMGAMFLASALNRGISPGISNHFLIFPEISGKLIVVGILLLWQIVLKITILRRCKYT